MVGVRTGRRHLPILGLVRGWRGLAASAVALLALAGVLAMHGLALHGVAMAAPSASAVAMGEPATASSPTASHASAPHDHHASATDRSPGDSMLATSTAATASTARGGGHLHHGVHDAMAAMCLAVLLLALALLLPAGGRGVLVGRDARRPLRFMPPSLRVARDPPDLHALSVLRC